MQMRVRHRLPKDAMLEKDRRAIRRRQKAGSALAQVMRLVVKLLRQGTVAGEVVARDDEQMALGERRVVGDDQEVLCLFQHHVERVVRAEDAVSVRVGARMGSVRCHPENPRVCRAYRVY
jgi:hypothetical protein